MTGGDLGKENLGQKNRILACGVELSSIKQRHYDIKTGDFSDIVLPNIQFVIGAGEGNSMVSGEALFFPRDKGVSLIMGRHGDCDITIDQEIIVESEKSKDREAAADFGPGDDYQRYEQAMEDWAAGLKKAGLGELHYMMSSGDRYVSRHQLQISRHPNGATIITPSAPLGGKSYQESDRPAQLSRQISKSLSVLSNYAEKPAIDVLQGLLFVNSRMLINGDVIMVEGRDRRYCFKYFEETDKGGLTFKPAMMIKQSYPLEKPIEEIHQELIVGSKQ